MKVLKRTEQKNVILNKDYYTEIDLMVMETDGIIFSIDENHVCENCEIIYRVPLDNLIELKVVYNHTFECYETVGITHNGKTLHVEV